MFNKTHGAAVPIRSSCAVPYDDGVYPLKSTYSSHTQGMTAAAIQELTFDNITLTDDQKALLAKDQKGNDRAGTIMGAYVLTE